MTNFILYYGPTYGLRTNENYLNFRWLLKDTLMLASITQQGNAAVCHFYSDKRGLKYLKQAVSEWCEYVFKTCDWCKMMLGVVEKPSVEKLMKSCGFRKVAYTKNKALYMKEK